MPRLLWSPSKERVEKTNLYNYFIFLEEKNKIQLVVESEINEAIISASYYEILKEYFKQMIEKENEKIVLKKI